MFGPEMHRNKFISKIKNTIIDYFPRKIITSAKYLIHDQWSFIFHFSRFLASYLNEKREQVLFKI